MCGMCTVRCPIRVEVEDNKVKWIEGNPHLLGGALCGKGAAGPALVADNERPHGPLIRSGPRGSGRWDEVSWERAYEYITEKLQTICKEHGPESVMMSFRGGPFGDMIKAFIHGLGSPNFTNHDSTCGRNVHHSSLSLYGLGRTDLIYDIKNSKHLVLFGRNILASLRVAEVNQVLDMLDNGGRLTYVDVRPTLTAIKASRFFRVRPGTDYALALAVIHEIIKAGTYDKEFVERFTTGFDQLSEFIQQYNTKWAAGECGIKESHIMEFVQELAEDRPKVIFHPGWMLSRYRDSFYASRALHILNILMGNLEMEGGQIIAKGPGDYGYKDLQSLDGQIPKPTLKRGDGVGWKHLHFDKGPGLFHLFYQTMVTKDPYPIKSVICYRHDPLTCFPDPEAQKKALDHTDLLVSIDTHYSEFGWYSDVILPESTYLERDSMIATQNGPKPRFIVRRKAVEPAFDTKPAWKILKNLADRLGFGHYFPYNTIEELWEWQLKDTGLTIADFEEKGFVPLCDKPFLFDRETLASKIKTTSGKIELISTKLSDANIESLKEYRSPQTPPDVSFRLIFGRSPLHSHSHTINNPILHEMMPENTLWINKRIAAKLGIREGEYVDVSANGYGGPIKARLSEQLHPEAVYMVHGFGRRIPLQTRAYNAGLADQRLMSGLLDKMDPAGGGLCLCECFVTVKRSSKNPKRRVEL